MILKKNVDIQSRRPNVIRNDDHTKSSNVNHHPCNFHRTTHNMIQHLFQLALAIARKISTVFLRNKKPLLIVSIALKIMESK